MLEAGRGRGGEGADTLRHWIQNASQIFQRRNFKNLNICLRKKFPYLRKVNRPQTSDALWIKMIKPSTEGVIKFYYCLSKQVIWFRKYGPLVQCHFKGKGWAKPMLLGPVETFCSTVRHKLSFFVWFMLWFLLESWTSLYRDFLSHKCLHLAPLQWKHH